MNAKYFEVILLLNKKPGSTHKDATLPQEATKKDANGNLGKYYHVSVKAPMKEEGGFLVPQQTKSIAFTIFESGIRSEIFKDIQEALANPANYDKLSNGDVKLHRMALSMKGDLVAEEVDFLYTMTDSAGNTLMDPVTKKPRVSKSIQMFIFASEDEAGLTDVIMAAQETRARRNMIKIDEEKEAAPVVGG